MSETQRLHEFLAEYENGSKAGVLGKSVQERYRELERERATASGRVEDLKFQNQRLSSVLDVLQDDSNFFWQKPTGSKVHKLREAVKIGHAAAYSKSENLAGETVSSAFGQDLNFTKAVSFVVEHNWLEAFAKADIEGAEYVLPYDHNIFEFRIANLHCCLYAYLEKRILMIEDIAGWWHVFNPEEADRLSLYEGIKAHVRAICIALDAEVATTEIVRAPHKLNAARQKRGAYPLVDYHVVKLARRTRPAPLPEDGDEAGTHRRLHFVRGHWRHYDSHKTWIKWHLRGDPDLGFIDKHYRL